MNPFIIIQQAHTGRIYYIKPVDILSIIDNIDYTEVNYRELEEVKTIDTLITGKELHTELARIEKEVGKLFFGSFGGDE